MSERKDGATVRGLDRVTEEASFDSLLHTMFLLLSLPNKANGTTRLVTLRTNRTDCRGTKPDSQYRE